MKMRAREVLGWVSLERMRQKGKKKKREEAG